MKRLLLGLVLVVSVSCVGTRARNTTLLPAAQQAWPNVKEDYSNGVRDGLADGDLTDDGALTLFSLAEDLGDALVAEDIPAILSIPWETEMSQWAVRGIHAEVEAGRLGVNGSQILLQRVANFTAALQVLSGRLALTRDPLPDNPWVASPSERRVIAAIEEGRCSGKVCP